jgi:hypothetical protein
MGGAGEPPQVKAHPAKTSQAANVTAFKRPASRSAKAGGGSQVKSKLPVALIFVCLVVVYTAFRYFFR